MLTTGVFSVSFFNRKASRMWLRRRRRRRRKEEPARLRFPPRYLGYARLTWAHSGAGTLEGPDSTLCPSGSGHAITCRLPGESPCNEREPLLEENFKPTTWLEAQTTQVCLPLVQPTTNASARLSLQSRDKNAEERSGDRETACKAGREGGNLQVWVDIAAASSRVKPLAPQRLFR